MPSVKRDNEHLRLTVQVTASYLSNNRLNPEGALELLRQVHRTLASLDSEGPPPPAGSPWWRPGKDAKRKSKSAGRRAGGDR